jgi:hypothetical protein
MFFFDRWTPTAWAASPTGSYIVVQQLLSAARDSVGIQLEKSGKHGITAIAEADLLQTSEQSPLLFVEQAIEQQDGGFEFVR